MKKLKMWLYKKIFKDVVEMHENYITEVQKALNEKNNEIKNLKQRLSYYHNKGVL